MTAVPALDRLLRLDGTIVICVDETGATSLPVPDSLAIHTATELRPSSPLDLLDASSYARGVTAFLTALSEGTSSAVVQLADSLESRRLSAWDLRDEHDCIVLVVSDAGEDAAAPLSVPAPVVELPSRMLRSRVDATGRTMEVDPCVTDMLGWAVEDYVGASSLLKIHPDDHDRAMRSFAELLARPGGQTRVRIRFLEKDGPWRWFEVTHTNRLNSVDPHILSEALDIEAEMEAVTALQDREELLGLLTESLPIGVLHMRADGTPDLANAAWRRLLPSGGIDDLDALVRCLPDVERFERIATDARDSGATHEIAVTLRSGDRIPRHADLRVQALPGDAPHALLISLADTTAVVNAQRELGRIARRDHLTKVLNRFGLEEELSTLISELDGDRKVTVLYIDLDGFKAINDALGHRRGDDVLVSVAAEIRHQVRSTDLVARLGGDEFIAVLRETAPNETDDVVSRLRQNLGKLSTDWELPSILDASVGVAVLQAGDTFDTLMNRADRAMYAQKARRRVD